MPRGVAGGHGRRWRSAVRLAGGTALTLGRAATWQRSFEELLVAVCAAALLACGVRLWLITTATTVGLVRGRVPGPAPAA